MPRSLDSLRSLGMTTLFHSPNFSANRKMSPFLIRPLRGHLPPGGRVWRLRRHFHLSPEGTPHFFTIHSYFFLKKIAAGESPAVLFYCWQVPQVR